MRVYLDACVIIYLVDASEKFHKQVLDSVHSFNAEGNARLLSSRLSLLECRVRAIKQRNELLLTRYQQFFGAARFDLLEIDSAVIERATRLRVDYGFRSPDAIHLASAIESNADVFVTGDLQLKKCKEIRVEMVASV